jgi:hypothetical protein
MMTSALTTRRSTAASPERGCGVMGSYPTACPSEVPRSHHASKARIVVFFIGRFFLWSDRSRDTKTRLRRRRHKQVENAKTWELALKDRVFVDARGPWHHFALLGEPKPIQFPADRGTAVALSARRQFRAARRQVARGRHRAPAAPRVPRW